MAVHLSIGLIRSASLAVSLVAVVGLAVVAVAVHFPIYPGPVVESVPGPGSAEGASENRAEPAVPREQVAVARRAVEPGDLVEPRTLVAPPTRVEPQNLVEPGSRPKNMAPIPVRAPRRANGGARARSARTLFERGVEIKIKRDANVYLTPRHIPKNDRYLKAYDADKAAKNNANAAPGLLGIATQAYRSQSSAGTANKVYSLADAMRDAVWRKRTAAKLKTLLSARNTCPEADAGASKPSIGLGNTC